MFQPIGEQDNTFVAWRPEHAALVLQPEPRNHPRGLPVSEGPLSHEQGLVSY